MKHPVLVLFVLCLPVLSGCIVQDIHDQIAMSNQQLTGINDQLASIDENLTSIDAKLAAIDGNLATVDGRMASLQGVLDAITEHLASLRRTINNIDSTIPFLRLSGDDDEAKEGLEAEGDPTRPSESSQPEGSGPDRVPAPADPEGVRAVPGTSAADGI